jgi:TPR repeat protein
MIQMLKFFPMLILLMPTSFAWAAAQAITPAEYRQALAFHTRHGEPYDIRNFDRNSTARKALLLSSTYWLKGSKTQREIARRLLLQAVEQPDALNKFNQGYAQRMLGDIEQQRRQFDLAEQHYRQAIAVDNESACVNLGAMWEAQQHYEQALKIYTDCLPALRSPILLMNLGTLYYNGLGMARDLNQGADYWQQSFEMFAYDPDVNYNLGLYHLQHSKNFTQARYHFALAYALGDKEAAGKIADPELIGLYADRAFADELRETDKDHRRELLQERLRYTLEKRYFNKAQDGMTFSLGEDGNLLVLSGKPKNAEARERAIIQMFRLIYVDRFSPVSLHISQLNDALAKTGEAELLLHHFRHKITVDKSGHMTYEVRF